MHSFAAVLCSGLLSAAVSPAGASAAPELKFEKFTLPNGLDVIFHEDHETPIVGVNVWYHVGSKNERPGRTGFAHLFEHMMFQGSKHYDKDYFGPIQRAGGKINGSTSTDRTNYWETVPANYLELALWMEADRMGFLLPAMTQAKLDNQREVVKNERRQSYENRPYGLVRETILAAMYSPEHPYSWPVIGSMKDIDAASREDIAAFFRRYYNPANASLCIAGDFDPVEAKRLVQKYFGPLPAGPKIERMKPVVPELKEQKRIRMTDRVGLPRLYLAWPSAPHYTPDDGALDILAQVLGGGRTSRLYRKLVREKQIAQDVQAGQDSSEIASQFTIVATARPGHTLAELEAAVAEEVRRMQAEPLTADEIARAVNTLQSHFIRALEPISEFGGRADRLNMYNVLTGDPGYLMKDFERLRQVDAPTVSRVAKQYLGDGRVVVEVLPGKEQTITPDPREAAAAAREKLAAALPKSPSDEDAAVKDEFDRSVMPGPAKEPKFQLPPIHRSRLSNGMELLVVENHELPLVNLHVVFPVGRADDPAKKPGVAAMLTAVWDQGTKRRSAEQIADELAGMGASLHLFSEWDTTSGRLFTLKSQLGPALDLFADVLRNPAFPRPELERQRAMALGRLAQARNEPLLLANMAASQLVYGPDHPYGRPRTSNPAALRSITREDLESFYRTQIRPERAAVIAVGDVTPAELAAELEKVLAGWKSPVAAPSVESLPPVPEPKPAAIVLVDKPGAAQSVIEVALVGSARKSPDYFPMVVMNTIFGGQFMSRLNMNLREDKGYTYGARSMLDWRVRQPGLITATASVQTRVTAPALAEFLKELDGMTGARPIGGDELEFCRKYITRGYPGGFETSSQVAGQLETLLAHGLPDDYFNTVVPNVGAVTAEDVQGVAKKYLKSQQLVIVVVGDRTVVEPQLRKLPLGKDLTVCRFDEEFRLAPVK